MHSSMQHSMSFWHTLVLAILASANCPSTFVSALPKGGGGRGGGGSRGSSSSSSSSGGGWSSSSGGGWSSSSGGSSSSSGFAPVKYSNPRVWPYSYPTSYVPNYPYRGYWISVPYSGPNGETGCKFYDNDTNRPIEGHWRPSCEKPTLGWHIVAAIVFGIVAIICCCGLAAGSNRKRYNTSTKDVLASPGSDDERDRQGNLNGLTGASDGGVFQSAPHAAAMQGNEFIAANPCIPFNPQQGDLEAMTDPHAWKFVPPLVDISDNRVSVVGDLVVFQPPAPTDTFSDVSIVTNLPLPWLPAHLSGEIKPPSPILYFEVTIVSMQPRTTIAVGLSTVPYPSFRLPGWHDWSVGFHSDDGRLFVNNDSVGQPYALPFRIDDVVGVGVDTGSGTAFFTRNGSKLPDVLCTDVPAPRLTVKPCIGADGECTVRVNFGTAPFKWDVANEMRAMYALELLPTYSADDRNSDALVGMPAEYPPPPAFSTMPAYPPAADLSPLAMPVAPVHQQPHIVAMPVPTPPAPMYAGPSAPATTEPQFGVVQMPEPHRIHGQQQQGFAKSQ